MHSSGTSNTVTEAAIARKPHVKAPAGLFAAAFAVAAVAGAMTLMRDPPVSGSRYVISQKNRHFTPAALQINRGDTVMIVNDDADLHHHAYVSTPAFRFDSGDQKPGSRTPIVFTEPGRFNVLCGIHPKMRLIVTVK